MRNQNVTLDRLIKLSRSFRKNVGTSLESKTQMGKLGYRNPDQNDCLNSCRSSLISLTILYIVTKIMYVLFLVQGAWHYLIYTQCGDVRNILDAVEETLLTPEKDKFLQEIGSVMAIQNALGAQILKKFFISVN